MSTPDQVKGLFFRIMLPKAGEWLTHGLRGGNCMTFICGQGLEFGGFAGPIVA